MPWVPIVKRVIMLFVVIIAAASINFVLPKLAPKNPVEDKIMEHAENGAQMNDISGLVAAYNEKFGLDKPIMVQYFNYLEGLATFDLGYSITFYPTKVSDMILNALPWTIGLVFTSTIIAFLLGSVLGALVAWRNSARIIKYLVPGFMVLAALPYYLLGLVMIYLFAFIWRIFPLSGGYSMFAIPSMDWSYIADVLHHSLLPALSIVLTSVGTWALAMRGMMVTVQGEDYMVYAEANGIGPVRRFLGYGVRNAMLPQITTLALHIGHIAGGAVLVERVFGYPGLGMVLFQAIEGADYFVIYGVVLMIIVMVALAMFLMDLLGPVIDPRVKL
ncbi:MAG TPA: ABC transporter permease [Devosiaceae bacterium]